jgi:hypothetical protein
MSLFHFDFKTCISGATQRDHEGYDCFNEQEAKNHADDVARKKGTERPDLIGKGYISVIDLHSNEIYRSPV